MSRQARFFTGIRQLLPIAAGIIPFAIICGVVAVNSGIPRDAAISMSLIIFAGASQLVAAQLYASGVPWFIVVLTASVVNLRMLMYSAALARHFAPLSWRWKLLTAYLLTDQAFAISAAEYERAPDEPHKEWFYLGAALTLFVPWQVASALGVLLGSRLPPELQLDFAAPLSFIAVWIPGLRDRPLVVAAIVGGLTAAVFAFLPYRLGLLVGAFAGIAAGYIFEARRS